MNNDEEIKERICDIKSKILAIQAEFNLSEIVINCDIDLSEDVSGSSKYFASSCEVVVCGPSIEKSSKTLSA